MKTVLVTGASRGIGLSISKQLIADGYRVVGVSRSLSEEFKQLKLISHFEEQINFIEFDLINKTHIANLISEVHSKFGPLYGLVNNAGVGLTGILATMHEKDISSSLTINLEATILLTKYVCRHMLQLGEGRVVNISSIIASTGFNGMSVYAASKAGIEGFTKSTARELGKKNITVNCIAPGYMETDMTLAINDKHLTSIRKRSPLGLAEPADVATMVSYLLSESSKKITGTIMTVDGGSTA